MKRNGAPFLWNGCAVLAEYAIVMNALNIIGNAVFVFGFDMKVIANSRHKKTGPQYDGIEQVSMEEIIERSDVISIHCPHTKETENLLNREAFAKMKDGVIIINTARGIIIDEEALLEARESRKVYMQDSMLLQTSRRSIRFR